MRSLLVETLRVVVVAACLGAAASVLRGVPTPDSFREVAACAGGEGEVGEPSIPWIDQDDARELVGDEAVTFVDARPMDEYLAGHVAGALPLPMDTGALPSGATSLVAGYRTVIAYCDTSGECAGSRRLAGLLRDHGIADVRVLRGGIPEWLEHGYPAEAGPCGMCP